MISRRDALLSLVALSTFACEGCGDGAKNPAPAVETPLVLPSLVDCFPGAGLSWLLVINARAAFAEPETIPAIARVLPEKTLDSFTQRYGIDPRAADEIVVAEYENGSQLYGARAVVDPNLVERAFTTRAVVTSREIDHASPNIPRIDGHLGDADAHLAILGRAGAVISLGKGDSLRAVEAFALGKLKRAKPALKEDPLVRAVSLLGDAVARGFAPGPFTGERAKGFGGLLAASTAAAASAKIDGATLAVTLVLTGAWGKDGHDAALRLSAACDTIANAPMGRLFGLASPTAPATSNAIDDAIFFRASYDADRLAKGLRDATGADVAEIMGG